MRRDEAIEAAARALSENVFDGALSVGLMAYVQRLRLALALPPDAAEPSERERALVNVDAECDAIIDAVLSARKEKP